MVSLSASAVTTGTITGRVVDLGRKRTGIPAVEVRIHTYGEKPTDVSTYTDANGRFELRDVPRVPRAKLTALRRGWQNYPTIRFINTEKASPGDVAMVSEGGTAEYYRQFAAEIADTDAAERRELRALWFHLPEADVAVVKREFAAIGGDPEDEYILYLAEQNEERPHSRQREPQSYADTSMRSSSTETTSTETTTAEYTTTRSRLRKD